MNKIKILAVFLLLLASILSASASLELTDVKLGGESQERGMNATIDVTVNNNGDQTIENLAVSFKEVDKIFSPSGSLSATTVAPGESVTLHVEGYVPLALNAVDDEGNKVSFYIGDVLVSGNYSGGSQVSKQVMLLMEAENKLEFKTGSDGCQITLDGDEKRLRDGNDYDEISRNDEIQLQIIVENTFDDDDECDGDDECVMEDVEVTVNSDDGDLELDEEDFDIPDIDPDEDEEDVFIFDIPDDADEDDYEVELWVTGEDPNGARHGQKMVFTLEVEVPKYELTIKSLDLFPDTLECDETETNLEVTLENTGRKDIDDLVLEIYSNKLDINDAIYGIEIEEGDRTRQSFDISLSDVPEPGEYTITVEAHYDDDDESEISAAVLKVRECSTPSQPPVIPGQEEEEEEDDSINIIEVPPTAGVIYGETKTDFFDSNEYVLFLGALFIIGLMLLVILLVVLIKK